MWEEELTRPLWLQGYTRSPALGHSTLQNRVKDEGGPLSQLWGALQVTLEI